MRLKIWTHNFHNNLNIVYYDLCIIKIVCESGIILITKKYINNCKQKLC